MASASLSSGRKRTTSASHNGSRTPSKRRRLQLEAASSPSTPKALNAIQAAISNVFSLRGRQNGTKGSASPTTLEDEIANSDEDSRPTPTPRSAAKMNGSARKVAFQIDESSDELSTSEAPTPSALERRRRSGGQQPAKSPLAVRRIPNGLAPTASRIEVVLDSAKPKKVATPSSAARRLKAAVEPRSRTSGKGKRLQDSFSKENVGHAGSQTGPLSKNDLFDDLPKDISQNNNTQGADSAEDAVSAAAETDEEICQICSKPESTLGNEILFCDGCDRAFHQKCYGVLSVPEGDWFCKDCEQGTTAANLLTDEVVLDQGAVTVLDEPPDIPSFEQHLRKMQSVLLARCTGRRRINLRGQDEAYDKVHQLVEQTVLAGEGNTMLIIGARGSGKTTLVEGVMSDLAAGNGDAFHTVRLNGFIHTDDKLALKEIWRQLGKEMDVEDELVQKTNNYADTLQSLLAVLSHPSEIGGSSEGVTSRSVVFVIDEFDLFATHARQTLLYNLFDIAQARKAPIAVLGLTTRIDVVESLEKRVKSRFSHRYVHLALVKSLPAYWDICRQGLTIDQADMATDGLDVTVKGHREFWKWWESKIEALYEDQAFKDHLEYYYYSTKSVPAFLVSCILPLTALSPSSTTLTFSTPPNPQSLAPPDSKLHLLRSLSDLELSLLISAARLDIIAHTDTVNFAMAYDEYVTLMGKHRLHNAGAGMLALGGASKVWGRGVGSMAWERLTALGLLLPAAVGGRTAGGGGGQTGAGSESRMWKVDLALEEIAGAVKLSTVLAKWCREI